MQFVLVCVFLVGIVFGGDSSSSSASSAVHVLTDKNFLEAISRSDWIILVMERDDQFWQSAQNTLENVATRLMKNDSCNIQVGVLFSDENRDTALQLRLSRRVQPMIIKIPFAFNVFWAHENYPMYNMSTADQVHEFAFSPQPASTLDKIKLYPPPTSIVRATFAVSDVVEDIEMMTRMEKYIILFMGVCLGVCLGSICGCKLRAYDHHLEQQMKKHNEQLANKKREAEAKKEKEQEQQEQQHEEQEVRELEESVSKPIKRKSKKDQ